MRIAVAGKGGSGKTTIAGTMARLLGRRGRSVLAIDGDNSPNLGQVLGLDAEAAGLPLPGDLLVQREDPACPSRTRAVLVEPVEAVLARYGSAAPDNVRLVLMTRVDHAGKG